MARRKARSREPGDQTNPELSKQAPHVQAEQNSIAVGGIDIRGNVTGSITIGHEYTAEQVSLLLTQITSEFQPKPFDGRCPYKGLEVFEEEDAELFFGRERLVADLLDRVKESRTVFITGPSGSGKSTLVDILAARKSSGEVFGSILVNDQCIGPNFKSYCGYVTQVQSPSKPRSSSRAFQPG